MEAEEEGAEAVSCGGEGGLLGLSAVWQKRLANEASNQNHNVRTGPY